MYSSLAVWLGIVLGGVVGCLGLWVVLNQLAKVPFSQLGGKPGKHLWSVIFMIPVPFLLTLAASPVNWLIALAWLAVAPSAGIKFVFGPKNMAWGQLLAFNAIFGVIALLVYWLVVTNFTAPAV